MRPASRLIVIPQAWEMGDPIPYQDVSRTHTRLLQALGDRQGQRRVRRNPASTQPIHLQSDSFAGENICRNDALPCFQWFVASGESGHGFVQQVQHALLVGLRSRAVQRRIACNHHFRFAHALLACRQMPVSPRRPMCPEARLL